LHQDAYGSLKIEYGGLLMPTETMRRGVLRWRGVVKINGKIVSSKWFRKGEKERRKAIIWEEEEKKRLEEEAKDRERQQQQEIQTPTDLLQPLEWGNKYLDDVQRRCSDKTYGEKKTAIRRFLKFTKGKELSEITPGAALQYLQKQFDNRSGHAANKDRKNLMTAWEWGRKYADGFPNLANPFAAVDRFPEKAQPRYIPAETDFWKVYEKTQGQDKVMLSCFLYLAARRGELFRLKWSDVDFHNGQVRLTTKKTRDGSLRADWIPMTDELKSILRQWWANRPYPDSEYVFTMLGDAFPKFKPGDRFVHRQHVMGKLCKKAVVKKFGFHAIRHMTAVILYKEGKPVSMIQKILRHQHPTTTERYLSSLGFELDEMKEALQVLSNRGPEKARVIPFVQKEKTSQAGT
jgi:integrase